VTMSKNWFITGSSRGLGRSLVIAALEAGDRVVATARKPEALADLSYGDRLIPLALDVTDAAAAKSAIAQAVERVGRLDVVVNNAGQGFLGAFEEMTDDEFDAQIDLNFFGVVNVSRAAIPVLRAQRGGHLIQVSSVGGRAGAPGLSGYQAAKFAVEGFSEVLWHELKPLGVRVTIVEPGGFRTDWAGASMAWTKPIEDYQSIRDFRAAVMKKRGYELGDPDRGAKAIVAVAQMATPPLRLPLGSDAYAYLKLTYESNLAELERTKELTLSTDFPDATSTVGQLSTMFDRR
jgi:NAD(P)-dependent dehydrogenase (short-subunit alcohol dehydrogenase family)